MFLLWTGDSGVYIIYTVVNAYRVSDIGQNRHLGRWTYEFEVENKQNNNETDQRYITSCVINHWPMCLGKSKRYKYILWVTCYMMLLSYWLTSVV